MTVSDVVTEVMLGVWVCGWGAMSSEALAPGQCRDDGVVRMERYQGSLVGCELPRKRARVVSGCCGTWAGDAAIYLGGEHLQEAKLGTLSRTR